MAETDTSTSQCSRDRPRMCWPTTVVQHIRAVVVPDRRDMPREATAFHPNATALETGMDPNTLARIIAGEVWCDIRTLGKLEELLDVDLWPGRIQSDPAR